ncbi:MAG: O-antigen ligase family protein [Rivularia sp. (in: cyanobacteria)]
MKRKHLEIAEKVFVVIGLTFFTGGFEAGATETTPALLSPTIVSTIRYTVWCLSLVIVIFNYKKALVTASQDIFIWILTPIVYASSIWSLNPEYTEKFMVEILQMTSFALFFATRFTIKQQVRLVAWTFAVGAIVSIFVVWRYPGAGLHWHDHPGSWKGIYDYKNTFGSMMVIGSIAFLLIPIDSLKHQRYKWGFFFLSLVMIYFSTSKTSLIVAFLVFVILYFYRKFRWQGKLSIVFIDLGVLIVGGISTLVVTLWIEILSAFGKDPTLTGRLPMWGRIFDRLLTEQPLFGFGRGGFWADESNYAIEAGMAVTERYLPPHAHNGYIDLALDVGLVGLSLFLISLSIAYIRSLKLAYNAPSSEYIWPLGFLLFLSLNNLSESYLLRLANVYWVLYVTTALSVGKEVRSSTFKLDVARRKRNSI